MRVDFVSADARALHAYLQSLIDKWPHVRDGWTPEQHQVWRAFDAIEGAVDRESREDSGD